MRKILILLSCIALLPIANANTNKKLIAKVTIENAAPEGASALLYKTNKGCLIEYTEYYETGKQQHNYVFNQVGLISASQIRFDYANGGLSNPSNKTIQIAKQEKVFLDAKNEYIIMELNRLKHEFKPKHLNLC